jgi:hypothetical protein
LQKFIGLRIFSSLVICLLVCFNGATLLAQSQTISGTVTDSETGEPIPYVNIVVTGKFHGTSTDLDGKYKLDTRQRADSLTASAMGYLPLTKKISGSTLHFELQSESFNINEITINAGENPADILFRKMIAAKPVNNPANLSSFQYESYTKYEIDLDNVKPEDIEKSILLKGFDFLKDYIDTMSEKGKSILPIFFLEQISDNYRQTNPEKNMERVKGQKMTFIKENPTITELVGNVNQNLNVYDNLITIMGKSMVSPVADYGLNTYKFHINELDTLYLDGQPHFVMKFKPKRKGDFAFSGKMMINILNYGVRNIEATIPSDVNIGFVKDFTFIQEFIPVSYTLPGSDSTLVCYAPAKENLKMNLTANVGKSALVIAKKSKSYQNHIVNQPISSSVFDPYKVTMVEDSAYLRDDNFWDTTRHESLLKSEAGIYEMVDSLKRTSKFKVVKYALGTIVGGFAKFGPVELGNVSQIFSRNQVEGWRIRMGIRTNRYFSERMQFYAYGAYGFDDKRFKYGGKSIFILSKKPWHKITLSGRSDIDFMSRHAEEMDQDNVFTLVQKKNVTQRLYNIAEGQLVYDNEFYKDMTSYTTLRYRTYDPFFPFEFEHEGNKTKNYFFGSRLCPSLATQI